MCKTLELNSKASTYLLDRHLQVCMHQLITREIQVMPMQLRNLCKETAAQSQVSMSLKCSTSVSPHHFPYSVKKAVGA